MKRKALLMLENGYYEYGEIFSGNGTIFAEFVFNTSMTGYEEIITDPSYKGQVVVFTYPLIGNYGITLKDTQSQSICAEAIVIREISDIHSNFNSDVSLTEYLDSNNIIGIEGIDTRALTKQIRNHGALKGGITNRDITPSEFLVEIQNSPSISNENVFEKVIQDKVVIYDGNPNSTLTIAALDFGIKSNIILELTSRFKKVILVPFDSNFEDNLSKYEFDGLFLSNGPGDPRVVDRIDTFLQNYIESRKPLIAICFGHQLIGKSFGMKVVKLPFGHHGGNHPVKNLADGKVYITAQNHNYAIDLDNLNQLKDWELTWLNLYDNTVEGLKHKVLPINAVQFHPEASPGPNEANSAVFDEFYNTVSQGVNNA